MVAISLHTLMWGGLASEAASQASPKGFSVADFFKPFQLPISKVSSSDVLKALGKFLPVRYQKGITSNAISGCRYHIGDYAEGGVIIWLTNDGMHGLVVAIEDAVEGADTKFEWATPAASASTSANNFDVLPFATPNFPYGQYYAGYNNQKVIENLSDWQNKYPAFRVAANYTKTVNGKTYDDWWLPGPAELLLMYPAKGVIKQVSEANGGAGLVDTTNIDSRYWSSYNVPSSNFSSYVNMNTGSPFQIVQTTEYRVRCVRAF